MVSSSLAAIDTTDKNLRNTCFDDIINNSRKMREVISFAKEAARSDCSIIIMGESGTGKELFARAIHNESTRKLHPFIPVNCGAIPDQLLESEFFGYEKGAFTGAMKARIGKFEAASKGTVFLDEISEIPQLLQVKLLRVLQEKEVCPVGSNEIRNINARVIAASNKDLFEKVNKGEFREDLYYRLNVVPIAIPPLRERPEDIMSLSRYYVDYYALKMNKAIYGITDDALKLLMTYYWPGNVRELQNTIEYAVSFSKETHISMGIVQERLGNRSIRVIKDQYEQADSLSDYVKSAEKKYIEYRLGLIERDKSYTVERVCQDMKISRATFYRKVKELGIHFEQ